VDEFRKNQRGRYGRACKNFLRGFALKFFTTDNVEHFNYAYAVLIYSQEP